jgi:hypothetical protein
MRIGQNEFYIVVPDEILIEFREKLNRLNITVDKFFTYNEILSSEESENQESE